MSKLPIGIVDTNRITHNLINLAHQNIADNENTKLSSELSSIYKRVNNFNKLLAGKAPIIAISLADVTRKVGNIMRHENPVRPHFSSNVIPTEINTYDLEKATDNSRGSNNLHSTEEMYSWFRYQVSFPLVKDVEGIKDKRDQYINALAWATLAYIKNYDVDYIDSAVDFAISGLNKASQEDFSNRLQRRVKLIHSESLSSAHDWIKGVFNYHAKYESSVSVMPQIESIPDMSIVGIIARTYEYDLRKNLALSKSASIELADLHHPMNQEKIHLPQKIQDMCNSQSNKTPSMTL